MMKILKNIFVVLLFAFLYAPIILLIVFSFNESASFSKWTGFSFKWYSELFKNRTVMPALINTLSIALISAVVSTVVGTFSAFGIHHLGKKTKAVMIAHTLGNPFNLNNVIEFCKKHNLWLIEDNCDALGNQYTIDKRIRIKIIM